MMVTEQNDFEFLTSYQRKFHLETTALPSLSLTDFSEIVQRKGIFLLHIPEIGGSFS